MSATASPQPDDKLASSVSQMSSTGMKTANTSSLRHAAKKSGENRWTKMKIQSSESPYKRPTGVRWIVLAIFLCILLAAAIKFVFLDKILSHLEHSAKDASVHPSYGVSVMVAAIGLGIPCGAAITPFNLAAGGLFGVWVGSACVMIGCLIGCNLNWWIARYYLREWAQRRLKNSPELRKLELAVDKRGIFIVALGRLSPIFPFALLSYVLGVTNVTMFQNSVGTAIGLLPGILLQASMGANMKTALDGKADTSVWIGISFSILTTIFMTWQVNRIWSNLPDASTSSVSTAAIVDAEAEAGSAAFAV